MANQVYANNASAVLASGITDSATTITVATGQGASFPTVSGGNWAYITLVDTSGNVEIVKCTAHSAAADTFTCTRGQDGTTARAFSANDLFELRITKATLDTLRDVANQTSGTIDGVVIGGNSTAAGSFTTVSASTSVSTAALKAADGTAAATIANSTGVLTIPSSVLTTSDINGGTVDGVVIGGSSAAAGTFTTLAATGNVTLGDAATDTATVNGYMGVGSSTVSPSIGLRLANNALTSATQIGAYFRPTSTSAATSYIAAAYFNAGTAAASFTCADAYGIHVENATLGAGSTITTQTGVVIADQTNGAANYGVRSLVSSGTNKWNIYASGTAANYFAGGILVGVTSATTNGGKIETSNGITFPATQSACSNANTLDDYEEGSWTPSLSFTTSSTGLTYSIQKGKYTKVGNLVTIQCHLALSSLGSASGTPRITGLPFSGSTDTTNLTYNGSTSLANYGNVTFGTDPWVYISPSNPSYIFFFSQSGVVTEADLTGTSYFTFCMTYFV